MTVTEDSLEGRRGFDCRPIVSGVLSGAMASLAGHPLDTLRIRMQTAVPGKYKSAWHAMVLTVRHEGWSALYKGVLPNMAGYCSHSAIRFGVFGNVKPSSSSSDTPSDSPPSAYEAAAEGVMGGVLAGTSLVPVICTSELIKCRQQASRTGWLSSTHVLQSIWAREGLRGLTTGYVPCLFRSGVGSGIMFGSFGAMTVKIDEAWSSRLDASGSTSFHARLTKALAYGAAGTMAGSMAWMVTFPADLSKTVLQTHEDPATRPTMTAIIRDAYRRRILYAGLGPTLLRSVPTNAVYLPGYVLIQDLLERATEGSAAAMQP